MFAENGSFHSVKNSNLFDIFLFFIPPGGSVRLSTLLPYPLFVLVDKCEMERNIQILSGIVYFQ